MDFKMIPLAFLLALYLLQGNVADATIGVNWGRQNAQKLLPSNVVDLMLQNGVRAARIFTTEEEILRAFAGSGIELTINIPTASSFKTLQQANFWLQARKHYFKPSNVRQIYLADFAFSMYFNKAMINDAIEAMISLQEALKIEGYGDQIKVTIPHNKAVLKMNNTSLRPSEAEFIDEIKPEMITFLRLLRQNNAPFVVTITTIGDVQDFGTDFNFAFVNKKPPLVIRDLNGTIYTNAFEIMYDSYIWALKKLNVTDVKVIVGQVGWPTDGYPGANATMAHQYYRTLLPFVSSNKGTPMRPGAPIDIFIQGLTDENRMAYYGNATFTRHWGIYMSNGRPKYKIDLSGKGRNVYPAISKGIMRMPERWCVYNGDRSDITKVKKEIDKACVRADCTALAPGGSCSRLSYAQNVTYAFNMYFQFQYQNETECDFEGLGHVSTEDPSTPECVFPVEVVRPQQQPYIQYAGVGKGFSVRPNYAVFVILFSILGTLFWN